MPELLTQPSHALPKNAICPTKLTGCDEGTHNTRGKPAAGRHNPKEKGRSASAQDGVDMCTTTMPELLTQRSHALPKNAICPTKLTGCDEGTITREGNTWRGDITHERKEGQQVLKMGQVCAPHPCHNPSHIPRMHCRKNAICPTKLTGCDEGRMTRDENTWRGDITHERKECQQVHTMGQVCAPQPCPNPSNNPRMHCRKTQFAQPNSLAATKEECHRRETRGGET